MCCPFAYACMHVFTYMFMIMLVYVCMCTHMCIHVEIRAQYQESFSVVSQPYSFETGSLIEIVVTKLWTDRLTNKPQKYCLQCPKFKITDTPTFSFYVDVRDLNLVLYAHVAVTVPTEPNISPCVIFLLTVFTALRWNVMHGDACLKSQHFGGWGKRITLNFRQALVT